MCCPLIALIIKHHFLPGLSVSIRVVHHPSLSIDLPVCGAFTLVSRYITELHVDMEKFHAHTTLT